MAQQNPAPMQGLTLPAPLATGQRMQNSTLLPSARYQLQIDPRQIAYQLPALDAAELTGTKPNQVGVSRQFPISSATHGTSVNTADGSTLVMLAVTSPGAVGLRVHFTNFDVGPEEHVYVRGVSADGSIAGPYHGRGPGGDQDFWSSTIQGDTVVIEYLSRGGGQGFGVVEVSHLYATPDVLSCEIDASCGSTSDKNAVGRILFTEGDGNSYVCTGTLLKGRQEDFTPYFLTANHCISTQSVAQTVETYWFYQTTSCNSGVLRNDIQNSPSGADLLATDASKDFALLKLLDTPPSGVKFAGWDPNPVALGTSVFALHHPGGGLPPSSESYLRRSGGTLADANSSCQGSTGLVSGYRVNWNSGTTEAGSSGSAIWYGQEGASYLVGVLSCGSVTGTCTNSYDFYAKFSDIYPAIKSHIDPTVLSNDNFANAQVLSGPGGTATGSNTSATKQAGEPNHAGNSGGASVWYTWTAPSGGAVVIDTLQSNFDTLLAVYTGNSVGALTPRVSNDDVDPGILQSSVTFRAVAGFTYRIAVDGYNAARGNIVLRWRLADIPRDFSADGNVDVVWQNNGTGQRTIWLMNGTSWVGEHGLGTIATEWQIATFGDFNADGQVDIVWQNTRTGQRTIWLMNGAAWVGERALPTVPTQWEIAGASDFSGDGHVDILWQNSASGQRTIWLMNRATWVGERALPTVPPQWQMVGTGDFNRNGEVDILWQNVETGQRTIWLMSGTTWVGEAGLGTIAPQWTIAGAADFSRDGNVDIIWQHRDTGQRAIWLMNGTNWFGQEAALPTVATTWEIRNH